jgi:UDP-N-acetylmuramate dehydrogenase
MMPAPRIPGLAEMLPPLRGRVQFDAPLAPFTWFRVGGNAEVLVRPADATDLAQFLRGLPNDVPVQVIGACSNLIIRDGGLPGVTIRLARGFSTVTTDAGGCRSLGYDGGRTGRGRRTGRAGVSVGHPRHDRWCGRDECRCLRW